MKKFFLEPSLYRRFWFLLHLFCLVVASIVLLYFMGRGGASFSEGELEHTTSFKCGEYEQPSFLVMHVPSGGGIEPPIDVHILNYEEIYQQQQQEAEKNVQQQMRERQCAKKG